MSNEEHQLTRRLLVMQALTLLKKAVEEIPELPSTDDLAVLAAIAGVAHKLSLNELLRDAAAQGREFYPDQLSIILSRINDGKMIEEYITGAPDANGIVLRYVHHAIGR